MIKIKRPLLIVAIGVIIGIIYGLYLKISIAITVIILALLLFFIQKNKAKVFYFFAKRRKVILIIFISMIISNLYTIYLDRKYEKVYQEIPKNIKMIVTVVSEAKETEYYYSYEVKFQNKKFIMYLKKNNFPKLTYGMSVLIEGEYIKPQESRNYKGFNYKEYLQTRKIYGSIKVNNLRIVKECNVNFIFKYSNIVRNKILKVANEILPKDTQGLLTGILIGETEDISDEINEAFSKSSLSHILAISGSHITYIVIGLSFILSKSRISRKSTHGVTIIFLILFMFITRFSPSVVRACIMGIIMLFSKIIYRKLDVLNSIALSLIILLIYNPFSIKDIGLQLSYLGTIGIICFNKPVLVFLKKYLNEKIAETLSVTISAQIVILPIMVLNFNSISTVFIISNLIAVPLSGVIILLGYATIFIGMVSLKIGKIIAIILHGLIKLLIWVAEFTANLPFSSITVKTPMIINVILYYAVIIVIVRKNRIRKFISLNIKNKVIKLIVFVIILFNIFPKNLTIHFIDVGQRR